MLNDLKISISEDRNAQFSRKKKLFRVLYIYRITSKLKLLFCEMQTFKKIKNEYLFHMYMKKNRIGNSTGNDLNAIIFLKKIRLRKCYFLEKPQQIILFGH